MTIAYEPLTTLSDFQLFFWQPESLESRDKQAGTLDSFQRQQEDE